MSSEVWSCIGLLRGPHHIPVTLTLDVAVSNME